MHKRGSILKQRFPPASFNRCTDPPFHRCKGDPDAPAKFAALAAARDHVLAELKGEAPPGTAKAAGAGAGFEDEEEMTPQQMRRAARAQWARRSVVRALLSHMPLLRWLFGRRRRCVSLRALAAVVLSLFRRKPKKKTAKSAFWHGIPGAIAKRGSTASPSAVSFLLLCFFLSPQGSGAPPAAGGERGAGESSGALRIASRRRIAASPRVRRRRPACCVLATSLFWLLPLLPTTLL